MFGFTLGHLLILVVVIFLFRKTRLPLLGRSLKKAKQNFKDSYTGVEEAEYRHLPDDPPEPPKTDT